MSLHKKSLYELGAWGEQAATRYLMRQGLEILAVNWHCPRGELDVVARDHEMLVFVEVKTRTDATDALERIIESFTPRKRDKLLAAIHHYLSEHGMEEQDWRLDLIAVFWRPNEAHRLKHWEHVLDW